MTNLEYYEQDKIHDVDHVATPRFVVEDIYKLINIQSYKMVWFPFNNYDSEFKLNYGFRTIKIILGEHWWRLNY